MKISDSAFTVAENTLASLKLRHRVAWAVMACP